MNDDWENEYEELMKKKDEEIAEARKKNQVQIISQPQQAPIASFEEVKFQSVAENFQQQPEQQFLSDRQQIPQPKKILPLMEIEKQYTVPADFKSFMLLKHEINSLQNGCLKQNFILNDPIQLAYYQKLVGQFQTQIKQMTSFVEQGKLDDKSYVKWFQEAFKQQATKFKKAQDEGNTMFQKRIQQRIAVLKDESQKFQTNSSEAFKWVLNQVAPGIQIPAVQKPEPVKKIQLQQEKPLSNFKSDMNAEKLLEQALDGKPIHIKFEFLLKRYKQYHNYALYLSKYLKNQKSELLNTKILPLLEKGKYIREQFKKGQNPSISNYLTNELKELTFEEFQQMTLQQYKEKLTERFEQILNGLNEEKKFQKLAMHSKPIIQKGKQTISAYEDSKKRVETYNEALCFIKSLKDSQQIWRPLPEIVTEQVQTQVTIENKEIEPNKLIIKFKRLVETKVEKFYIVYSLEVDGKMVTKQSAICAPSGVYDYKEELQMMNIKDVGFLGRSIDIKIFEKGFIGSSEVCHGTINFEKLKSSHTVEQVIQMQEYGLYVREPFDKYTVLQLPFIKIETQYPPFDKNEGIQEYLDENLKTLPTYDQVLQMKKQQEESQRIEIEKQKKIEEEQKLKEAEEKEAEAKKQELLNSQTLLTHMDTNPQIQAIKAYASQQQNIPGGLTEKDLLYPEDPTKSKIFNFITPYTEFLEKSLVVVRQDPSQRQQARFLQNMWEDYLRVKAQIEKKLANEDFEWYIEQINGLTVREDALIDVYTQLNLPNWVKFVQSRKSILLQELQELQG